MKQRIIGLVLLGIFMMAHPAQAAFGGFSLGGNFGVLLLQGRHWYTGTPSPDADQVKRLNAIGTVYGVHARYLVELGASKIVVGGELYALSPSASPTLALQLLNAPIEGSVKILHNRSIGFVLVAGMMFNPKVMVSVSAGMEMAKFQFTYTFSPSAGISPPLPPIQIINHSFKPIVLAIGATYKITPHMLVGLEIASPFFKRFKVRMIPPRAYHYKPVERRAMLKLSYLF